MTIFAAIDFDILIDRVKASPNAPQVPDFAVRIALLSGSIAQMVAVAHMNGEGTDTTIRVGCTAQQIVDECLSNLGLDGEAKIKLYNSCDDILHEEACRIEKELNVRQRSKLPQES